MEQRTLDVLEYPKILKRLSERAVCPATAKRILSLTPVTDRREAERLIEETDEAVRYLVKHPDVPLQPLSDIEMLLKRVEVGAVLSCKELLNVGHLLRISRKLKQFMTENSEEHYPLLDVISECLVGLPGVENEINRCILSEDTVADDASPALYDIRRKMEKYADKIRDVLEDMIHAPRYQNALQESLVTMRNGRFVLPVKMEHKGEVQGIVHDSSATGATVFIEPIQVVEISNEIQKLNGMEKEEVEKILTTLTNLVADYHTQIGDNYTYILQADMVFARGHLAWEMEAVKPRLNEQGVINIRRGRHPLIEKKSVVPVDVYLGRDFDTLVITGPNTGGKTVTLKTLGLFSLMAQTGLHIPAGEGSELSVFDDVFADIGDEQSIEQSLSTFSSHMVNIVNILSRANDRSLVLFDELGAGTDPAEGAALAVAILEYVKMCGAKCAATTHYSEIKLYALTTERVENAACEFDVTTLRPTYRLLIGVPGKSNAFAIASRLGISDYIIGKAKEHLTAESIHFEDVISDLEKNRQDAEAARREAEQLKQENEQTKQKLAAEQGRVDKQKNALLQEARREAKRIVEQAKKQADEAVRELSKAVAEADKINAKKRVEDVRRLLASERGAIEDKLAEDVLTPKVASAPKTLLLGQTVEVVTLGQRGTVVTLPDAKGNLIVQTGILKVTTNIASLRTVSEEKRPSEGAARKGGKAMVNKTLTVGSELDLRGQMADEALLNLEKFIDDAVLSKLETVRVIHGKGTGTLRGVVHQFCRRSRQVKDFRLGVYGEGETGVTVITLS